MTQGLKHGTVLRGSYRIERILGQGGFGITYLAVDITLDRKIAIKEFFPKDYCERDGSTSHVTLGTRNTTQFVNRLKAKFIKEAKNIAKFDHPGIIKIHAAFEENNTAYYVMDFIEGESLSATVKRDGPFPEDAALQYISKVGKALEYVHSHRMNHLDVKPANIMIRRSDNEPILIDFGLSKQYDTEGNQTSTTPTGISHGYAPMEQYNDGGVKEFSPQTDLYSLAATLYYILSGVVPLQATRLIDDELTFPTSIPAYLVSPIAKAMSTARRNRHNTVDEFLEEINEEQETEIISESKPQLELSPIIVRPFTSKVEIEYHPQSPYSLQSHMQKGQYYAIITRSEVIVSVLPEFKKEKVVRKSIPASVFVKLTDKIGQMNSVTDRCVLRGGELPVIPASFIIQLYEKKNDKDYPYEILISQSMDEYYNYGNLHKTPNELNTIVFSVIPDFTTLLSKAESIIKKNDRDGDENLLNKVIKSLLCVCGVILVFFMCVEWNERWSYLPWWGIGCCVMVLSSTFIAVIPEKAKRKPIWWIGVMFPFAIIQIIYYGPWEWDWNLDYWGKWLWEVPTIVTAYTTIMKFSSKLNVSWLRFFAVLSACIAALMVLGF